MSNWRQDHGSAFDVPALITSDRELRDLSYKNDVCPCFVRVADLPTIDAEGTTQAVPNLWINHPDPDEREVGGDRYLVTNKEDIVYEGNDVAAAVAALKGCR